MDYSAAATYGCSNVEEKASMAFDLPYHFAPKTHIFGTKWLDGSQMDTYIPVTSIVNVIKRGKAVIECVTVLNDNYSDRMPFLAPRQISLYHLPRCY